MLNSDIKRKSFSCVVPVKGNRPYFDVALASLQGQCFGDDLEVIIQDGDIDEDSGQSDALNKGFAKAHGEWFFWLNADDVLLPGVLNRVFDVIERNKDTEWIAGDTVYMIKQTYFIISVRADMILSKAVDYSSCRNFRRVRQCRRRCGSDKVCRTLVRRRRQSGARDQEEGVAGVRVGERLRAKVKVKSGVGERGGG